MRVLSPTDLKARIDTELRDFVQTEADLFEAVDPLLAPLGARLRAAVADGKRIRAAFCYWGWRAAGQGDTPAMVRAAAAMELVHAAALDRLLGRDDLGAADLAEIRAILQRSGARGRVEQLIAQRVRRARSALAGASVPREAAEALYQLADAATARSS